MPRPRPPKPWSPPPGDRARLLVVRLSALGDVVHGLPALAALRAELPGDARIDWLVEDRAAALLAGRPELDRVVVFPRRAVTDRRASRLERLRHWTAFRQELHAFHYDAALDLQGNLKSGLLMRMSGARFRYGLDRREAREGNHLLTNRRSVSPPGARHRVERGLGLVAALLGRPSVAWVDAGLPANPDAEAVAAAALEDAGLPASGYVLLHPGTSPFGAFKRWPTERFADLAGLLSRAGHDVAVSVPPDEAHLAEKIVQLAGGAARPLTTPGLAAFAETTRRAAAFVAADTGPLHVAALAGTPVVGLFGPKDASVYAPYGRRVDGSIGPLRTVTRSDVACRPCRLRHCPAPVCMTGLAPDDVLTALCDVAPHLAP